jgi:type IX secretion system PorP/SprF family membrane protein
LKVSRHILFVLILFCIDEIHGQQPSQYSLFMNNKYAFNPAFGGLEAQLVTTGVYRNQWSGLEGNPNSRQITAHSPVYPINGAVGILFENDIAGVHRHSRFAVSYNYFNVVSDELVLSAGLSAGVVQRVLDGTKIRTPGGIYEGGVIDHLDPRLPNGVETGYAPTFDAGIYAAYGPLELGIGVSNLLNNSIQVNAEAPGGYQMRRTFFINAEYQYEINDEIKVVPAVLVKTDITKTQIDFGAQFFFQNNFSGGLAFRGYNRTSFDALVIFGGIRLSQYFYLHYAYDATLSSIRNVSSGTHEIMIVYKLGRAIGVGIPQRVIYNPRLL